MTPADRPDSPRPTFAELAAYSDGELDAVRSAAVEAWLADHPRLQTEVDSLRRLMRFYQETQPPQPDAAAWEAVRQRLHAALDAPTPAPAPLRGQDGRPLRRVLAVACAAALVCLWLGARWGGVPAPEERDSDEPYLVASDEEVTVISMRAQDAAGLVVGQPPIGDNYEFASPADVTVVKLERADGDRPAPEMLPGEVPMLIAPDVLVSNRQD